jgi:hypothetical protein
MPYDMLLAVCFGALTWTLLEYLIHRFLGHVHRTNLFAREHLRHHAEGNYFAPAWKKVAAAVVFALLLGPPAALLVGVRTGLVYVLAVIGAWLAYEWIHWWAHVHPGWTAYGRWVRRNHFAHHFHHPRLGHGVSSPVWDLAFGTWKAAPERIEVPERLAMRWLLDERGELRPEHAAGWTIRRRSAHAALPPV